MTGKVFTHRVSADEIADDVLTVTPDLEAVAPLARQRLDGTPVDLEAPRLTYDRDELIDHDYDGEQFSALILPPGTLRDLGVAVGDLVGVRATAQRLVVEKVDAVTPSNAGAVIAGVLEPNHPREVESVTWAACSQDPTLFTTPAAPLSEIIDEQGMARDEHLVASAGFDFIAWNFEAECRELADDYDLSSDDAIAVTSLLQMHRVIQQMIEQPDIDDELLSDDESPEISDDVAGAYAEFGAKLADPTVAEALFEQATATGRSGAAALGLLAETLRRHVPRGAQSNCWWLQAAALERLGDVTEAERELLAIESSDPNCELALYDLARFASDRGDAERGLSLLRRAGAAPDDHMVQLFQRYVAAPRSDIGRNEPCWCGSGRKYKKCHLGHEQATLLERSDWLYAKAVQHVMHSDWDELLTDVRVTRARAARDEETMLRLMDDPLVIDNVLVEGGGFAEFLEQRSDLLPADELELLRVWAEQERSVYEIVRVDDTVTVRDLLIDETLTLLSDVVGGTLKPGQVVCARALPVGDGLQFVGALVVVNPEDVDDLIELLDEEPSAVDIVEFFSPPAL
jgi:tetratricopeptide (TPR) repeat protein